MRLLFINYEFPPQGGGAGFAMLALADELVARGHEIDILTGSSADAADPQHRDGVRIHRVPSFRRGVHDVGIAGTLSFLVSAAFELSRLCSRQRYDALHYYFGIPTGLLSRLPGAHRSRPYVLSLRGSDVPGYDPKLTRLHWLLWPATKRVWRGAYRVVANSEGLRQIALAADADQRVEVIHNGIATATPAPRTNSAGALRILAVSRLIQRKGLDTLIRAIALLRDEPVSVVVAGDGPQRESLSALARQLAVGDRITFKGFLPQVALAQEHLDCDVFVLASHSESCSMALLHAMGAGLPVIASRVGGTPELVRHERNGLLFSAGSEIELAAAIRLMLREPARGVAYGAANVALSRDVHSWGAVASRYEALFRAAIADSAGAARKALV